MMTMTMKNINEYPSYDYDNDYDLYDYDYDLYDYDYKCDDDRPRISLHRKPVRAPAPLNLPSLKKQKENEQKLQKEKEKQEIQKQKIETFRSTEKTGIWGIPGWMVQDIDIPVLMEAKEKLQDELATGKVVMVAVEATPEIPKLQKKENMRDVAFEVLADKEKMKKAFEKTELCRSITEGGVCPHGENCRFLHDPALWKPRKCRFEDTCKCVKFICKPNGSFYIVNNGSSKVCKFIHGGESKDNFHARTKIPKPVISGTSVVLITEMPKKKVVCEDSTAVDFKGKLNWLKKSPMMVAEVVSVPVVVPTPTFNWVQMSQKLKSEGITLIKAEDEKKEGDWITPKTKTQKREEKTASVVHNHQHSGSTHQMTSLCRSVIQGTKCGHSICRYAHDVEKIVVRKCGFETCRNVVCVSEGVYKNTGRNVCNYQHSGETRDSYYKRLDIYKYKK